jgi:hypothetical protein
MTVPDLAFEGFDPYDTSGVWDTGWGIRSIGRGLKKASRRVKKVARVVAKNPLIAQATSVAQQALAATGPIGMAAAGALGGLSAVVRGQNLQQIALSAAEGASPPGIRQALSAARRVRSSPVIQGAVRALTDSLDPVGAGAARHAVALLGSGANATRLGMARRALRTEGERRAFDSAIGTVSRAARGSVAQRPTVSRAVWLARRDVAGPGTVGAMRDPLQEALLRRDPPTPAQGPADRMLDMHPEWAALRPTELAARLRVPVEIALGAVSRRARAMRPQHMSARAVRLVARMSPAVPISVFRPDAAGFEQSGTEWIYIVEQGDSPYALAGKYAPGGKSTAGKTYRQLLKANPSYPLNAKKDNFKNFWAGMRLKWPTDWTVPAAAQPVPVSTPAALPAPESVLPDPSQSLTAVVQAKALLATWALSDGASEATALNDYGRKAEDLTPQWTSRDKLILMAFSRWSNANRSTSLATDGVLTSEHSRELARWAEQKASAPAVPAVSSGPTATSMPSDVPALPAPADLPAPTALPPVPELQLPMPPMIAQGGEGGPAVSVDLPPPIVQLPKANAPKPAEAPKKKSSAAPLIAIAAAAAVLL